MSIAVDLRLGRNSPGPHAKLLCTDSNFQCAELFGVNASAVLSRDAVSDGGAVFREADIEKAAALAEDWHSLQWFLYGM